MITMIKKLLPFVALLASCQPSQAAVTDRDKAELGVVQNYLTNGGCESGTSGLKTFNTTFTNGVPGSITYGSTKLSVAAVTTNVLQGAASCQLSVTTASGSTGHGVIGPVMTLKDADLARFLAFQGDYNFVSGTGNVDVSGSTTQTVEIWFYNVGRAAWIQPQNYRSINTKGTSTQLIPGSLPLVSLQSDILKTSNYNQYQVAFIIRNDPAGSFAMNFDNLVFGRPVKSQAASVSGWVPYTPSFVGLGTVSNVSFFWKQSASSILIMGSVQVGTTTATPVQIGLPNSAVIDSNVVPTLRNNGKWNRTNVSNTERFLIINGGNNYLSIGDGNGGGMVPRTGSDEINSGEYLTVDSAEIPITGSGIGSAGIDGSGVVVSAILGFSGSTTPNNTNILYDVVTKDTTNSYNPSTGYFTCPYPGFYRNTASLLPSTGNSLELKKNGTTTNRIGQNNGATGSTTVGGAATVYCNAGEQLAMVYGINSAIFAGTQYTYWNIEMIPAAGYGNSPPSVYGRYTGPTGTLNGGFNLATFTSKTSDTHGAYSTSTGTLQIPVSGAYSFNAQVEGNQNWVNQNNFRIGIYDATKGAYLCVGWRMAPANAAYFFTTSVTCGNIQLPAGEQIQVMVVTDGTGGGYSNAIADNWFEWNRVGN